MSVTAPSLTPLGNEEPPYFPERLLACGIERKAVEASALEHGLVAEVQFQGPEMARSGSSNYSSHKC